MLEPKVVVELSEKIVEQLQASGLDDADVLRLARRALAFEVLRMRHVSIGLAAEIADLERAEFIAQLAAHKMPVINLSEDDLNGEFALLDSMLGKGGGR